MTPNPESTAILAEGSEDPRFEKLVAPQAGPRKYKFVLLNMMSHSYWHLSAIYGLYLCFTSAKFATMLFALFIFVISDIGVTAGSHRLWAHRSYKVKLPLEILLIIMNSIAYQDTAFTWARDHRLHHRYADTDADPHNSTRGFFYSHIGWLFVRKHHEVIARGKTIPIDDLKKNKVLQFQRKYAYIIMSTLCFFMPTFVPVYFWGESISTAWHVNLLRYVCNLNAIFLVNSASHMFGYKPYDKNIASVQNIPVTFVTLGEGYHNYHHTYPWDYKAAELGNNKFNLTTKFIDFFAWIGWAYDLKTVPQESVYKRMERTGDGTNLWGYERENIENEVNSDF
nr:fatty-acyl-CoA desaturase EcauDES4 [Cadra cautella]